MTELRMSGVFTESANRLPKETRAKLPKVFMLLTSNPRHPSLQLKKIKGATRPESTSVESTDRGGSSFKHWAR